MEQEAATGDTERRDGDETGSETLDENTPVPTNSEPDTVPVSAELAEESSEWHNSCTVKRLNERTVKRLNS